MLLVVCLPLGLADGHVLCNAVCSCIPGYPSSVHGVLACVTALQHDQWSAGWIWSLYIGMGLNCSHLRV